MLHRIFSRVDLPVPLAPTSPVRSLGVTSQSQFSNRSLWPKRFPAPESWIMRREVYIDCTVWGRLAACGGLLTRLVTEETQRPCDVRLHLAPLHHRVQEAVLEQEFAVLESGRQLLADGLLDHPRPGESDQRARLGDIQVPQHREARRYAARGRIGQHAEVGHAGLVQAHERG